MKYPLEWHKNNLRNLTQSCQRHLEDLERGRERYLRMMEDRNFLIAQIAEAERRGLTEFDHERLLVKRGKK